MPRTRTASRRPATRPERVNRERVMRAAIAFADKEGIEALTMRRLGQDLGVEAMALYRHVRDKDDLIDGMIETLVAEIPLPDAETRNWKQAIRARALAARGVFKGHPWAARVITSRSTVNPALLAYIEWSQHVLQEGRFSYQLGHDAGHVLGSRLFGFVQEPFNGGELDPAMVRRFAAMVRAGNYPTMTEGMRQTRHDDDREFEFGLDLILDGLERARDRRVDSAAPDGSRRTTRAR